MSFHRLRKSDSRQGLALYFLFLSFFVIAFSMSINQAVEISQTAMMQQKIFSTLAPHKCSVDQEPEYEVICPLNQAEEQ